MAPNLNGHPNNNIDPGGPSPLNLIFAYQLKTPLTMIFKWSPNNNIDPGDLSPLNLIFPTNLNGLSAIIFKWPPI